MKFKVGDKVRCHYNDNGTNQLVGLEGVVTKIRTEDKGTKYPYATSFYSSGLGEHELELIQESKQPMSVLKRFTDLFVSEPEKSFRKLGILDDTNLLTNDGMKIYLSWKFKQDQDEFMKEVGVRMIEEEEKEKK